LAVDIVVLGVIQAAKPEVRFMRYGFSDCEWCVIRPMPARRAGALVVMLEAFEQASWPVHIVYTERTLVPLKLRAFLNWATPRLKARLAWQVAIAERAVAAKTIVSMSWRRFIESLARSRRRAGGS
jgi:hypothetical protein